MTLTTKPESPARRRLDAVRWTLDAGRWDWAAWSGRDGHGRELGLIVPERWDGSPP